MRFDSTALRTARVDHDLSQRQLADEAGVSVATISRLEGGSARKPAGGHHPPARTDARSPRNDAHPRRVTARSGPVTGLPPSPKTRKPLAETRNFVRGLGKGA